MGEGPQKGRRGSEPPPASKPPCAANSSVCHTGYTTCYHPQAVSQMVNSVDTNLLFSSKQPRVCRRPSQPTSGV